jgi:hypothetical protein
MINKKLAVSSAVLTITALTIGVLPVLADELMSTTTSHFEETTTTSSPATVISPTTTSTTTVTTTAPVTKVIEKITVLPLAQEPDLIARRNDLLARIEVEKSRGRLTKAQADSFIAMVMRVDSHRPLVADGSRIYYETVKRMYKSYDRIASGMESRSGLGDRELADTYGYLYF